MLAEQRSAMEARGVRLALVHLASDEDAHKLFSKYELGDVARFSDPEKKLYQEFGLKRGGPLSLILHPKIWWRGLTGLFRYGVGKPTGDPLQMPGAILIDKGKVVSEYHYKTVADMPEFQELYAAT